jgi:hypothetical protein
VVRDRGGGDTIHDSAVVTVRKEGGDEGNESRRGTSLAEAVQNTREGYRVIGLFKVQEHTVAKASGVVFMGEEDVGEGREALTETSLGGVHLS